MTERQTFFRYLSLSLFLLVSPLASSGRGVTASFLPGVCPCGAGMREEQSFKEEEKAFLQKNKTAKGVKALSSGLQVRIVRKGKGRRPTMKDEVYVKYTGRFVDGTVFDQSVMKPAIFRMTGIISGLSEGLALIPEGSTAVFYIPSALAYGSEGSGPVPPDRMLIFEVELLEVYSEDD